MVPCRFETFGLHAAFEGIFPFKHVGRQVAQDCQIFRAMVFADAAAHRREHCIEVQLPFLQRVLPDASVVPIVAGDVEDETVASALETFVAEASTLLVASSDLSHYHPYEEAKTLDASTARTIERLEPSLTHEAACGATAINGLLHVARRHGMTCRTLDLRTSGDTAGGQHRREVVGYGAFAFHAN